MVAPGLVRCSGSMETVGVSSTTPLPPPEPGGESSVAPLLAEEGVRGWCANFAKPKSKIFACPRVGDENIGWLDVAVNDPLGVRCIEGIGNRDGEVEKLVRL